MQQQTQMLKDAVERTIDENRMRKIMAETKAAGFEGTAAGLLVALDWIFPPRGKQENCEGVPSPRAGQEDK